MARDKSFLLPNRSVVGEVISDLMHLINSCRYDKGKVAKKYLEAVPNNNEYIEETSKEDHTIKVAVRDDS